MRFKKIQDTIFVYDGIYLVGLRVILDVLEVIRIFRPPSIQYFFNVVFRIQDETRV